MNKDNHNIAIPNTVRDHLEFITNDLTQKQAEGVSVSYETFVKRLFKLMETPPASLHHASTGISGEAGEILDVTKKVWVYNKPLDSAHLVEELGDIRFYYQAMLNLLNLTDENIQAANTAKLSLRYPGGNYSDELAQKRLDKKGENNV